MAKKELDFDTVVAFSGTEQGEVPFFAFRNRGKNFKKPQFNLQATSAMIILVSIDKNIVDRKWTTKTSGCPSQGL